jgi:hypothetical protein
MSASHWCGMSIYRFYYLGSADRVVAADVFHCDTDVEARSRADALLAASGYAGIEVWDRDQIVYRARKTNTQTPTK